ncbi:O-methyltransferase [Paraburkholderia acidisoli]|uniref:Methyltransferase n=1 Tax=Paraburkholderia acidisoli TaxID=2571748 RepID=A0A7Z2GPS4_9BURK|nr:class I SAM-dependent methyltransferase [Paraburkholderia acidisoli]QGZ65531.1 methyltransferase [Paraburkholderia acidisoli]
MNSLHTVRVAQTLGRLFAQAEHADRQLMESFADAASNGQFEARLAEHLADEQRDVRATYRAVADNFLNVSQAYGRFLYQCARARRATRIVEFGTSMGISTLYLAAALRDNGGGRLIGTELEAGKAARAQANLDAAGLGDLVEIRVGDARETLADLAAEIDFVLLDGAFSLYLPVLKLLEPKLASGTPVLAENAIDIDNPYLAYVRDPAGAYLSQPLAIDEGRGNEFSVFTG